MKRWKKLKMLECFQIDHASVAYQLSSSVILYVKKVDDLKSDCGFSRENEEWSRDGRRP